MKTGRLLFPFALLFAGVSAIACGVTPTPTASPVIRAESETPEADTIAGQAVGGEIEAAIPPQIEPIEVTYFTPSQQEGPYYTVNKPADDDNDLVDFAGATGPPTGQVLVLSGIVYNASGLPVKDAVIEIWQTDSAGVYLHPNDPGTDQRDRNFQFYGEAITDVDGVYSFRTILPGRYEPRPRHIHVKVKKDGEELLTTQFYFGNEVTLTGDEANLLIEMAPAEDDAGNPIWVGERNIILRQGG